MVKHPLTDRQKIPPGRSCRARAVVWPMPPPPAPSDPDLPPAFAAWFAARGWTLRPHQRAMLAAASARRSSLLIAPTGGGKTLAGFLPSLIDLAAHPRDGLHTLYVS